jgi:hypothetical protein
MIIYVDEILIDTEYIWILTTVETLISESIFTNIN